MEGLRILARIIARHYLAHPELYPQPVGDADGSRRQGNVNAKGSRGGRGVKRVKPSFRARLDPDRAWERLQRAQHEPERTGPAYRPVPKSFVSDLFHGRRYASGETRRRLMDGVGGRPLRGPVHPGGNR